MQRCMPLCPIPRPVHETIIKAQNKGTETIIAVDSVTTGSEWALNTHTLIVNNHHNERSVSF